LVVTHRMLSRLSGSALQMQMPMCSIENNWPGSSAGSCVTPTWARLRVVRVRMTTLLVREYDEAIAFYVGTLGFELVEDTGLGDGKRWVRVRAGDGMELLLARAVGEAQRARVGDQTGGRVLLFVETDDFARDHALLQSRGVRFVEEPRHETYGVVVVLEDLYGNRIDLIQPA
jgi:catechol 2,3-dioxygenase-like lactoylglutathione lyase family enzyme